MRTKVTVMMTDADSTATADADHATTARIAVTSDRCPICGANPVIVNAEVFGYVAHCGQCYDGDPESPSWRLLSGRGMTPEDAVSEWLDSAREYAAVGDVPALMAPVALNRMWLDLSIQVVDECERQSGWLTRFDLVRHIVELGPA